MSVSKTIIDQATARGIVPGAVLRCAFLSTETFVMPEWAIFEEEPGPRISTHLEKIRHDGTKYRNRGYVAHCDNWATVVTPAIQGLQHGDWTECDKSMRLAILERAKTLGIHRVSSYDGHDGNGILIYVTTARGTGVGWSERSSENGLCRNKTPLPYHEFITRMEATPKAPKPIVVNGEPTLFSKGHVDIGGLRVDNKVVRQVLAHIEGKPPVITVGTYALEFRSGYIKAGCQNLSHDLVREIAGKLVD